MENLQSAVDTLVHSSNTLFILIGAVMVLAMHAGFAFLEVGTVRQKNQVNALSKILSDFAVSTLAYFFIGYWISYGVTFLQPAAVLSADHGYGLVKFFFLLTFAAAIPAIISGGIAERARFVPQLCATALIVAFIYPFFEGMIWNGNYGLQAWLAARFGAPFHDFAGSVVVHAMGGWLALAAVLLLGPRNGRYRDGRLVAFAPSVPEHDQDEGRQADQQQQCKHQRQAGEQQQADGACFLFLQLDAEQLDVTVQKT